jgi:hypothetical protein
MLSESSGDPTTGSAFDDLDLSFLDEGLPPDDDLFRLTAASDEFDKGPMPSNEVRLHLCCSDLFPPICILCCLCSYEFMT